MSSYLLILITKYNLKPRLNDPFIENKHKRYAIIPDHISCLYGAITAEKLTGGLLINDIFDARSSFKYVTLVAENMTSDIL